MKLFALLITVCFLQIGSTQNLSDSIPFNSDVRTGTLSNGMKYYIKKNGKPEKRAELRLALNAGSLMENDDQQGLAHFCEHMCFNGTKNFKKSELIDYLESAGVKFGAHLNAYTSFDETVYMLQLPTDKEEVFTKGFQVLEDWAHNVSFDPEEIDKERGVVISERRGGLGSNERMRQQWWPAVFANSRYGVRLPIGQLNVLQNFKYQTLIDFYKTWYRPELMSIMVVGDFDLDKVEKIIKDKMGAIPATTDAAAPKRPVYEVPDNKGLRIVVASDSEATQTVLQLNYKQPVEEQKTLNDFRKSYIVNLYNEMLNNRLNELIKRGGTPLAYAGSGYGNFVRTKNSFSSTALVNEKGIEEGVKLLLTENERVRRYGFTQRELDLQKPALLKNYESSFKEKDKTESREVIDEMVRNFLEKEPMPGVTFEYVFAKQIMPTITLDEVNALTKKFLGNPVDNGSMVVQAPIKSGLVLPTETKIRSIFDDVLKSKIDPIEDNNVVIPLMATVPKAGSIKKEKVNTDYSIKEWTLSNGVRVVYKKTDFKNDEIMLNAYSPGGYSLYPAADDNAGSFSGFIESQSGLGQMDNIALQRYMTGKIASVRPYISELFEGMNGSCSPEFLETELQMVNLFFTGIRKDEKAFTTLMQQQRAFIENRSKSPEQAFRDTATVTLYDHNPRRKPFKLEDLDKIKLDRVYEIYKDRFKDASDFTFVFVGNIEEAKFKPLVETYLGSLPDTHRKENWKDNNIRPVKGEVSRDVFKGKEPKSQVQYVYTGAIDYSRKNLFNMTALRQLLDIKLREKIREDKGGTYGVGVNASMTKYPVGGYQMSVSFGCAPERVGELSAAALTEIQSVVDSGSNEKNLVKIKETFKRERETDLKDNRFWSNYITGVYQNNLDINDLKLYDTWVAGLKGEDFKVFAKQYLRSGNVARFILKPEAAATPKP